MLKSIGAVVGSYIVSVVLVLATGPLFKVIFPGEFEPGHIPATNPLLVSTALFIVISIFCAWLCARLAPSNAGKHVFWFFVVGEVLGIAMTIPNWNNGWPHWYWYSWLISWPISCWIGLMLSNRRGIRTSSVAA